jgi:hypothetical protein
MEPEGGLILLEKWGLYLVLRGQGKSLLLLLPGELPRRPSGRREGKERKVCLTVVSRPLPSPSCQQKVS